MEEDDNVDELSDLDLQRGSDKERRREAVDDVC